MRELKEWKLRHGKTDPGNCTWKIRNGREEADTARHIEQQRKVKIERKQFHRAITSLRVFCDLKCQMV